MHLRGLIAGRLNKPGRKAPVVGWNLLFLLWAGMLLVALTHAELLSGAGVQAPEVAAAPQPEAEPIAAGSRRPLSIPTEDTEPSGTGPAPNSPAAPLELPSPPDYPRVGAAYHNPGYDPAVGIQQYRRSSLAWLTHHQNAEGFWSAARFGDNSCREGAAISGADDSGRWDGDLACTSLALLSYVGAGYDHKTDEFRRNVRQAIIWLRDNQDDQGFKSARGVRDHALAVMALSETYGLSGDAVLKPLADKAVQQLLAMREADSGWGEYTGYPADTISTAYAMLAIKTARMSGLEFENSLAGLTDYMDFVNGGDYVRFSLDAENPPGHEREGFTRPPVCMAAWVMTMLFSGAADLNDERIQQAATVLAKPENLPRWERGRVDLEYWWLGSMAAYQLGGKTWKAWEPAMSSALLDNQRGFTATDKNYGLTSAEQLDEHGSWDTEDIWCTDGRVATTALAALCLEVYYRYVRIEKMSDDVVEDE